MGKGLLYMRVSGRAAALVCTLSKTPQRIFLTRLQAYLWRIAGQSDNLLRLLQHEIKAIGNKHFTSGVKIDFWRIITGLQVQGRR